MQSQTPTFTLEAVNDLVQQDLKQIHQLLQEWLQTDILLVHTLADHIIASGGKRLRPLLVLLLTHALGYTGTQHVQLASIIELIHTATLLHDDVIDGSTLRRSRPTANALFGNQASILCGDFLYSRAFQQLIKLHHWDLLAILASVTNKITEGELLQLINLKEAEVSESRYLQTIEAKTAILFQAAAETAAILSGANEATIQQLKTFGLNLGLAFQLVDDLLDYAGDTHILGKTTGTDYLEGKLTLPVIYALTQSPSAEIPNIRMAWQEKTPEHFVTLCQLIASSGAFTYTRELAQAKVDIARRSLAGLTPSSYQQALLWLCDFAITRQH